jgi:hypothetical protein
VQLFKILQEIKRRRIWVVIVVLISAMLGFLLAFKPGLPPHSRQYQQAIASSDILIDTRNSQVVDVGGHGPELSTLASRANLLGNLMVTGPLKDTIAEAAGVSPEKLAVVPPGNSEEPGVAPAPVETGQGVNVPKSERSTLTFSTDDTLPILHVVAEAPDAETARELALATVVNLRKYLAAVASTQQIPPARQLVVRQFGSPTVTTATRGIPHSLAFALALILALVGCAAVVGGSWFARSWKEFAKKEAEDDASGTGGDADAPSADADAPADDTSGPAAQKARAALLTRSWPL